MLTVHVNICMGSCHVMAVAHSSVNVAFPAFPGTRQQVRYAFMHACDIENAIDIDAKFKSNWSGWVLEHGLMMQGAWEPLIQKLSAAAAYGPKHKNHARCYFYNLRTTYALKPVVHALSPISIGQVQFTLPMLAMRLHSAIVHVSWTALATSPLASAVLVSHGQ